MRSNLRRDPSLQKDGCGVEPEMTKRKRPVKSNGHEEEKIGRIVWAQVKGVPRTMMWPVRLEGVENGGKYTVFCNADQAILTATKVESFSEIKKWQEKGIQVLKKRKHTLESFLDDITWATSTDCFSSSAVGSPTTCDTSAVVIESVFDDMSWATPSGRSETVVTPGSIACTMVAHSPKSDVGQMTKTPCDTSAEVIESSLDDIRRTTSGSETVVTPGTMTCIAVTHPPRSDVDQLAATTCDTSAVVIESVFDDMSWATPSGRSEKVVTPGSIACTMVAHSPKTDVGQMTKTPCDTSAEVIESSLDDIRRTTSSGSETVVTPGTMTCIAVTHPPRSDVDQLAATTCDTSAVVIESVFDDMSWATPSGRSEKVVTPGSIACTMVAHSPKTDVGQMTKTPCDTSAEVIESSLDDIRRTTSSGSETVVTPGTMTCIAVTHPPRSDVDRLAATTCDTSAVVIESVFDDMSWATPSGRSETVVTPGSIACTMVAHSPKSDVGQMTKTPCDTSAVVIESVFDDMSWATPSGRSETVVTPGSIACTMVAHSPKSDVGQMTKTPCDTSAEVIESSLDDIRRTTSGSETVVTPGTMTCIAVTHPPRSDVDQLAATTCDTSAVVIESVFDDMSWATPSGRSETVVTPGSIACTMVAHSPKSDVGQMTKTPCDTSAEVIESSLDDIRRTTSGSETVVTPGTMTCIAVTHPPRSDVDQLAATTCDTSAVVIESVFDDMSWATPSGRSEKVVTPGSIACTMVAHSPKTDVGQMTKTPCDTSAEVIESSLDDIRRTTSSGSETVVTPGTMTCIAVTHPPRSDVDQLAATTCDTSAVVIESVFDDMSWATPSGRSEKVVTPGSIACTMVAHSPKTDVGQMTKTPCDTSAEVIESSLDDIRRTTSSGSETVVTPGTMTCIAVTHPPRSDVDRLAATTCDTSAVVIESVFDDMSWATPSGRSETVVTPGSIACTMVAHSPKSDVGQMTKTPCDTSAEVIESSLDDIRRTTSSGSETVVTPGTMTCIAVTHPPRSDVDQLAATTCDTSAVVIESVFDDMSWATPSGRSETVVTPGSIACTMVAHSPKSDVGQMTKTPCDTSAEVIESSLDDIRRTTSGSETVVTPGTMTCIAVTHPPRSDVDQLAATTCDTSAVVIESVFDDMSWATPSGRSETVVTPGSIACTMVAHSPKSDVGQMTKTPCDTSAEVIESSLDDIRRTTSGSETVVTPGTMTCIAVTHPPRSDVDQLAATTCDTSAVVIESVFDDMSWATPSGRSEKVVTPGSIACTMVAHSPKTDVGQMTKTPCDTSAEVIESSLDDIRRTTSSGSETVVTPGTMTCIAVTHPPRSDVDQLAATTCDTSAVVIESVFDDMSWATPSGRSEKVVTPGSIACTMVAHSPKTDVGQMTKTPCDTSAEVIESSLDDIRRTTSSGSETVVTPGTMTCIAVTHPPRSDVDRLAATTCDKSAVVIESVFDDMSWATPSGRSETVVTPGSIACTMVAHSPKSDVGPMKTTMCDTSDAEFSNDLLDFSSGSEYFPEDDELDESDPEASESSPIEKKRKRLQYSEGKTGGKNQCQKERILKELAENDEVISDSNSDISVEYPDFSALNKPSLLPVPLLNDEFSSADDSDVPLEDQNIDPETVAYDEKFPKIYVKLVRKSQTTKLGKKKKTERVYDSHYPCIFCGKMQTNFSHHLMSSLHMNEAEVQAIPKVNSTMTKEEKQKTVKERKTKFELLRLRGIHKHNTNVISEGKGEIILARRSTEREFDLNAVGPCPRCFAWHQLKNLKRHQKLCPKYDADESYSSQTSLNIQSKTLVGRISDQASKLVVTEVFTIMQPDHVSQVAQTDPLIISLGNQLMDRNRGNRVMRKYYTSQGMRLSAKLLIALKETTGHDEDLNYFLQPSQFVNVAEAALKCSNQDSIDEEDLSSPSNAIKLGYDIKSLASSKLASAIIHADEKRQKEAENFLQLMKMQWTVKVTKLARMVLQERQYNKPKSLPTPEDIKKITEFMKTEICNLDLTDISYANYKKVAVLTLARITLYNRRRCHEVQAIRLKAYNQRKTGQDDVQAQLMKELTSFEAHLLMTQEVVEIRGKVGRCVPVILPLETRQALSFIASKIVRKACSIPVESPYLFGSKTGGVFRAYDAISTVAQEAGLSSPSLIRTSNMRKYMATMVQALDTSEAERSWIIQHLGHNMDVHLHHYRQTSDVLERTEVAKILLIQDFGIVPHYVGRKLSDIQLDDIISTGESTSDVGSQVKPAFEQQQDDDSVIPEYNGNPMNSDDEDGFSKPKKTERKRWSKEEEDELKKLFKANFEKDYCPKQLEIEKIMKKSREKGGLIHLRPRDNIKKKVSGMLVKLRKKKDG
nr:uncharacterized protein LOC117685927 isoform X13 [Crassostrea gigas]